MSSQSDPQLEQLIETARSQLGEAHKAREAGLTSCRKAIRNAGSAIRAVHRLQPERARELTEACAEAIREAQTALAPYPALYNAGFLHDAEKELAEAVLTRALIDEKPLPSWESIGVGVPAWLNGLAEAASELRRHLLDRLREGDYDLARRLLDTMDHVYETVFNVDDYPDAVTGGLRRTLDQLRAVLERTRSDLTTSIMQQRLQASLEAAASDRLPPGTLG